MERYHLQTCPVSVFQIARSRWTFPLLVELAKGTSSFGRLKKALSPITSKTLASCMRKALSEQLLSKYGAHYSLSARGKQALNAARTLSANAPECSGCPGAQVCQAHSL